MVKFFKAVGECLASGLMMLVLVYILLTVFVTSVLLAKVAYTFLDAHGLLFS